MELLQQLQSDIMQQIHKLAVNYKKAPKDRLSKEYIQARLELLENYWSDFQSNHKSLLAATKEQRQTLTYFTKEVYDDCLNFYLEVKTKMSEDITHTSSTTDVKVETDSQTTVTTRLPAIHIPSFSGDYREWLSFHDLFKSLVHDNPTMSKVNKCQYLKTSLRGEAENLVKQIPVTDTNYDIMWEMLNNRYNNKRHIANTYMGRLLNQKRITIESAKAIRELLDVTTECLVTLKSLDLPTDSWDSIIVYITIQKLDPESHRSFEQSIESTPRLPTWKELAEFLDHRFHTLEAVKTKDTNHPLKHVKTFATQLSDSVKCTYCNEEHHIFKCQKFLKLDLQAKKEYAQINNLCFNCLRKGHSAKMCFQTTKCRKCNQKHHTLIHGSRTTYKTPTAAQPLKPTQDIQPQTLCSAVDIAANTTEDFNSEPNNVILATSLVNVLSKNDGTQHTLRALVDQGSQACLITEAACHALRLRRYYIKGTITGIGSNTSVTKSRVEVQISSRYDPRLQVKVNAYVLKSLTSYLPPRTHRIEWPQLETIQLADPTYEKPGKIDLLLGADVYAEIIQQGIMIHKSENHYLVAQQSILGWLICGRNTPSSSHNQVHVCHTKIETDTLLQRFWELEEDNCKRTLSNTEIKCEKHYQTTHQRQEDGRYSVRLPFSSTPPDIGESYTLALRRFNNLLNKFERNKNLENRYNEFMEDYLQQNHMEVIPIEEIQKPSSEVFYLPHHAVINDQHITTKLRVVFDSSAKSRNQKSLNDNLLPGPALQNDIRDVTLKWRRHRIVIAGDIRQHYRQIMIDPRDRDYLRILWKSKEEQQIQHYRLTTVTYGTSCAPFQAIRTLKQLAEDERHNFDDETADTILEDFYIDDLLTGRNTVSATVNLKQKITQLLQKGGFPLHKWASNTTEIPEAEQSNRKILGINWNGYTDNFELKLTLPPSSSSITKRTILRDIATIYDPAGWLSPIVVVAKHMLQKLWAEKLDWDDTLPDTLHKEWTNYRTELIEMPTIKLQRWLGIADDTVVELHGFCDASSIAYSAVVYSRVITPTYVKITIIEAKTRVAPVKQISMPRLELCGAVLLAKLLHRIQNALKIPSHNVYAWTDATIVLAWLQKSPNTWTTFVANRVTEITDLTDKNRWYHVSSEDNPADVASRGISPLDLPTHQLWWGGPAWLHETNDLPVNHSSIKSTELEKKVIISVNNSVLNERAISESAFCDDFNLLSKYSSLDKLIRVTCRLLRFVNILKARIKNTKLSYPSYLTTTELKIAMTNLILISQRIFFNKEIEILTTNDNDKFTALNKLKNGNKIVKLNPFIDNLKCLRVGGRLHYSNVNYDMKHPVILSKYCNLSRLIIENAHIKTLHGGVQLMLSYIRTKYHIIGVKCLVKSVIHKCITCIKNSANSKLSVQQMGNLPTMRVVPQRPFSISGVDFAGPVTLKLFNGKCNRTQKAYISVFICMSIKAVHLELVTSLSTDGFIAAFRRFTSRRGHCVKLVSDCGTNFVGANKVLKNMFHNSMKGLSEEIRELLAQDGTSWEFNPPGAPHMGGLWESAVKSVKFHLNRTLKDTKLTYEEYSTLLCQIECCLNSRPLTYIDNNSDDIDVLTPGHFLILENPLILPEESHLKIKIPYTKRWTLLQQKLQSFWHKWSHEYLVSLQRRQKWINIKDNLEVGNIVLIKEDNIPPSKWLMGRIIEKYAGKDGLVRVVSIKCKNSIVKRPIHKLCLLPTETTNN